MVYPEVRWFYPLVKVGNIFHQSDIPVLQYQKSSDAGGLKWVDVPCVFEEPELASQTGCPD